MTRSDNLVPIAMLWGTEELKAAVGECERFEFRHVLKLENTLYENGKGIYQWPANSMYCYPVIIRKPTWTWCENPTDEMARLRPRCEVREMAAVWQDAVLLAVDPVQDGQPRYTARTRREGDIPWQYCRVRLFANGEVMVDREGEE